MSYAVETIGLTKSFSDAWGRRKVLAVDNLNLQIKTNEVFGLLGPNGSGKSTTIKMLLGLLHPTKGRALVFEGDGANPKINQRIGFLPEESYLYRYLNPRETLDFYGKLFGLPRSVRRDRTEALLDMVGLKAVATRSVGTFSKGMARRIGLAQALINDPDLLILDEPTTGLDPIGTRQIKDLIIKLAARGKTILLCSHLLADVEDVCDRISILYGGQVRAQGEVKELLQRADRRQITTGPLSDSTLDQIRSLIAGEAADCEISSPMERLETFFVRTVVEAQQQARPTSGAVSTTQIGDFLAGDTSDAILDQLVSASVDDTPEEPPVVATAEVTDTLSGERDQVLLDQLTEDPATAPETEAVQPTSDHTGTAKPTPVKEIPAQDVNRNLLDQLVNPDQGSSETDKPEADDRSSKEPVDG
ncbi:ABC transporter ATP-binding protein [Planctomycetota bacterium]